MLPRLYVIFSDAQAQVTQQSAVEFCLNSNSFKLLWLSSLPAIMEKIKSKGLEYLKDFPHYQSKGFFLNARGQLTPQSLVESDRNSDMFGILWLS